LGNRLTDNGILVSHRANQARNRSARLEERSLISSASEDRSLGAARLVDSDVELILTLARGSTIRSFNPADAARQRVVLNDHPTALIRSSVLDIDIVEVPGGAIIVVEHGAVDRDFRIDHNRTSRERVALELHLVVASNRDRYSLTIDRLRKADTLASFVEQAGEAGSRRRLTESETLHAAFEALSITGAEDTDAEVAIFEPEHVLLIDWNRAIQATDVARLARVARIDDEALDLVAEHALLVGADRVLDEREMIDGALEQYAVRDIDLQPIVVLHTSLGLLAILLGAGVVGDLQLALDERSFNGSSSRDLSKGSRRKERAEEEVSHELHGWMGWMLRLLLGRSRLSGGTALEDAVGIGLHALGAEGSELAVE
jgi:hypothetical protein